MKPQKEMCSFVQSYLSGIFSEQHPPTLQPQKAREVGCFFSMVLASQTNSNTGLWVDSFVKTSTVWPQPVPKFSNLPTQNQGWEGVGTKAWIVARGPCASLMLGEPQARIKMSNSRLQNPVANQFQEGLDQRAQSQL